MIALEGWPALACRDGRLPYGLMSLAEMVNCSLIGLSSLCSQLSFYETLFGDHHHRLDPNERQRVVPATVSEQIKGWLKIASAVAKDYELKAVRDRINIIREKMAKRPMTYAELEIEVRVLRETISSGMEGHLIYRYPNSKSEVLVSWKSDWAAVTAAFPSSQPDILATVDLWALGHATASVFHSMRILEHGLRSLAADVGLTFDIQNWQNIIEQIEARIRELGKMLPRGIEKNDRLQFLSEAAKEFVYFKDGWRNYVSHNRITYDEYQARSVMEHVKMFMSKLSAVLSE